ncbi:DUF6875 domain-containing protein [Streptomyces sp. TLI_146]|uniref:DUF6875 domain-containing protein n=1 Tax=Streptomyces sp. TLI_146 TaxID=1938858 RepID=UPI000C711EF8|nr:hypothetical protein [Streptomyces sp. TLI_146]PKV82634.1 hypothetical protein BX283_0075 [Streptomyces sp. TLI_146]
MQRILLTRPATAQRTMIDTWLDSYIMRTHPLLGRPGAVCPYVTAARRHGVIRVRAATDTPTGDLVPRDRQHTSPAQARTWLHAVLRTAVDDFEHHPWPPQARQLHCLIVLLQGLAPDHWGELDRVHTEVTADVMRRGFMISRFHPRCSATAVHNASFAVNRSPVPLIVIRRMARDDHLFADDDQQLGAYQRNFPDTGRRDTQTTCAAAHPQTL